MTYYNCSKFRCRSIFSFGVSRGGGGGGGGVKMTLTFQKTSWFLRVKVISPNCTKGTSPAF